MPHDRDENSGGAAIAIIASVMVVGLVMTVLVGMGAWFLLGSSAEVQFQDIAMELDEASATSASQPPATIGPPVGMAIGEDADQLLDDGAKLAAAKEFVIAQLSGTVDDAAWSDSEIGGDTDMTSFVGAVTIDGASHDWSCSVSVGTPEDATKIVLRELVIDGKTFAQSIKAAPVKDLETPPENE